MSWVLFKRSNPSRKVMGMNVISPFGGVDLFDLVLGNNSHCGWLAGRWSFLIVK